MTCVICACIIYVYSPYIHLFSHLAAAVFFHRGQDLPQEDRTAGRGSVETAVDGLDLPAVDIRWIRRWMMEG